MDTKTAIHTYQYAERIKSELIIASSLLALLDTLEGDERIGAEKLMKTFLEALRGEIKIAQNIEKSMNFIGAEKKVSEALEMLRLGKPADINRCISNALSLITTSCQRAMENLINNNLI
ncbi:hypothetical protein ACFL0O_11545 [Thermodesulfobacteriota bacterium]